MSPAARRVLEQALFLSESERLEIAGALLRSVQNAADREIERRLDEIDEGRAELIPWDEARVKLRRD